MTDDDITDTLAPTSDQLDAVDLLGGPRVFTIERVAVNKKAERPVTIHFAEFDRPWKPGKNMRRVLGFCWGKHASKWVGHQVELFCDPSVQYAGKSIGGTRIKRMSHIDGPKDAPVLNGQQSGLYRVTPLPELSRRDQLAAEWKATTDPDRRAAIEAEVRALGGGE